MLANEGWMDRLEKDIHNQQKPGCYYLGSLLTLTILVFEDKDALILRVPLLEGGRDYLVL